MIRSRAPRRSGPYRGTIASPQPIPCTSGPHARPARARARGRPRRYSVLLPPRLAASRALPALRQLLARGPHPCCCTTLQALSEQFPISSVEVGGSPTNSFRRVITSSSDSPLPATPSAACRAARPANPCVHLAPRLPRSNAPPGGGARFSLVLMMPVMRSIFRPHRAGVRAADMLACRAPHDGRRVLGYGQFPSVSA